MRLINAKPSAFGRKIMIALEEKGIPYELVWDIPWHADTSVADHNPLEQRVSFLAAPREMVKIDFQSVIA